MTVAPLRPLLVLGLVVLAGCTPPPLERPAPESGPRTRAERSAYTETASYADVLAFLDSLRAAGAPIRLDTLGRSAGGRPIPLVLASRPRVLTPDEARREGRPVVYVQGNIHGGEVEGKDAVQALLRDLTLAERPNALDSILLVLVPIYNPDGNEKLGPQARHRAEQNGPERVGERANAQGLDLNRDYIKAEAPETRAALAMFRRWDPEVLVDLHTTNGSYHGYALTYAPSLNPASGRAGILTRDVLLPKLRARMRTRHGFTTFDYGNFSQRYGADVNTDTTREGWFSYDARPRFGTNYYGVRGRVAILSEGYSHDPFERRVRSTYAFVSEILSLAAEHGTELLSLRNDPAPRGPVAVRSELTRRPFMAEVISEDLATADTGVVTEPGVPRGLRRTGRFRTLRIPVYDRFVPVLELRLPTAYVLGAADSAAVALLRLHGITVERTGPATIHGEAFHIDSLRRAERPFQGHREVTLSGRWERVECTLADGAYLVRGDQKLGALAAYLLEPQSDDGLVTWNFFGHRLAVGGRYPVVRVDAVDGSGSRPRC